MSRSSNKPDRLRSPDRAKLSAEDKRKAIAVRKHALKLLDGVRRKGRMLPRVGSKPTSLGIHEENLANYLAANVLRRQGRIDQVLDQLIAKRPHPLGLEILRIAVIELRLLPFVKELVVDVAVRMTREHDSTRHLDGLVNAVLRKVSEKEGQVMWDCAKPGRLPEWIGAPISDAFGEKVRERIEMFHEWPAAVDITLACPDEAERLSQELPARMLPSPGSLRLQGRPLVSELPGYAEGSWWVQDAAAAIPVKLLGNIAGKEVLDMCAAPGGKTMQCAAAGAQVTALDKSQQRLKRLRENLSRTGLNARVVCADATAWQPNHKFDVVIVDAPCTATGTIRRHPDLPFVKKQGSKLLTELGPVQRDLLRRAVELISPRGKILYCVCSMLPAEGEEVVRDIAAELALRVVPVKGTKFGLPPECWSSGLGLRTRPDHWHSEGGMDGFFSAVLTKG